MSATIQWVIIGFCVLLSLLILMRDLCPTLWRQVWLLIAQPTQADNVPNWLGRLGAGLPHISPTEPGCSGCSRCHRAMLQSPSKIIDVPVSPMQEQSRCGADK